jgi:hypothetical protein
MAERRRTHPPEEKVKRRGGLGRWSKESVRVVIKQWSVVSGQLGRRECLGVI